MTVGVTITTERATWRGQPMRLTVRTSNARQQMKALTLPGATGTPQENIITFPPEPLTVGKLRTMFAQELAIDSSVDRWTHNTTARFLDSNAIKRYPDMPTAAGWGPKLYPFQRVGAGWLEYIERGILGDDPGLGKTIQSLTAVRNLDRVLIVSLNGVKSHWARHVTNWLQNDDVAVAIGNHAERQQVIDKHTGWLIINHEMFRPGANGYRGLWDGRWDAVIVDEAHKFQGRHSLQSKGAEHVNTDRLMLLTGTPIWNGPESLWHMLRLLEPYRFSSYWRFIAEYYATQVGWGGHTEIIGIREDALRTLQEVVGPYLLRRKTVDVLSNLPEKRRVVVEWEPTPAQRKAYKEIRKKLRLILDDGSTTTYANAAAAMADARRVLNAPPLLGLGVDSPKDSVVSDLLDSVLAEGRKVIVYTWHVDYAQHLAGRFRTWYGSDRVSLVHGGMADDKETVLEEFRQNSERQILVATIGSVGTGIDLIEATAAIFAEGAYVPTLNIQAEGRLHRIGQKTDVVIYRLQANRTVENAIWNLSDMREDVSDEVLSFRLLTEEMEKWDGD